MLRGFEGLSASPFAGAFVAPTASLPDSDVDALAYGCGRPQRRGDALKCYLCECAIGLADPAVAKPLVCNRCRVHQGGAAVVSSLRRAPPRRGQVPVQDPGAAAEAPRQTGAGAPRHPAEPLDGARGGGRRGRVWMGLRTEGPKQ